MLNFFEGEMNIPESPTSGALAGPPQGLWANYIQAILSYNRERYPDGLSQKLSQTAGKCAFRRLQEEGCLACLDVARSGYRIVLHPRKFR